MILFFEIDEDDFMKLMREYPAGMFYKKKLWAEYNLIKNLQAMFSIYINFNEIVFTILTSKYACKFIV